MFEFLKQLSDKKLQKKVDESLTEENREYIDTAIDAINNELKYIDDTVGVETDALKVDVLAFSRLTALEYIYDEDKVAFFAKTAYGDITIAKYQDGKFNLPKMNGANSIYINIVKHYDKQLKSIAERFKRLRPYLKYRQKLLSMKKIVLGQNIYNAYISEYNFEKESKEKIKNISKNLTNIKGIIFNDTGFYEIKPNVFGTVDVDGHVINAIVLNDKWSPYSAIETKANEEEKIIFEHSQILNDYKSEYCKISEINAKQNSITENINKQIEERNSIITQIREKKIYENKKQLVK